MVTLRMKRPACRAMVDYGTVKDSLYPALHGANASAVTNANQCANAPAKARCDVLANNTQLYKLPQDVYNQMSPQSLSESQIVQVRTLQSADAVMQVVVGGVF